MMNHYQRLKIAQDAPPEVIRAAYAEHYGKKALHVAERLVAFLLLVLSHCASFPTDEVAKSSRARKKTPRPKIR